MNTKSDSEKLKPCLKSSKALDGSHAYNFDGICINCGKRCEETQPQKKGLEISTCECGITPKISVHRISFFKDGYFITCFTKGCKGFPAQKIFRSPEKAVMRWNEKENIKRRF